MTTASEIAPIIAKHVVSSLSRLENPLDQAIQEAAEEIAGLVGATSVVKALEWAEVTAARSQEDPTQEPTGEFEADFSFGAYYISLDFGTDSYVWHAALDGMTVSSHDCPDAAKAAAQRDFEFRVRYCLADRASRPAEAAGDADTQAARDVLVERRRQVEAEGWTPEHDDEHRDGGLAKAAASYAAFAAISDTVRARYPAGSPPAPWRWDANYWKPTDRRRDLVKAAALLLAEIDRLDRAALAGEAGR